MRKHRKRPRRNTPHRTQIVDCATDRSLGRLVNITADGMMLVSSKTIAVGRKFQVRLVLPKMVTGKTELEIATETVWCEPDSNPSFFRTGFRFLNVNGDDASLIEDVMHTFHLVG